MIIVNLKETQKQFSVQIYGDLVPYNDVLSQARCRIFYKGLNRNGTYITDEFADKLLSTLPYVPVKGIFSYSEDDYADHGVNRDQGRIYGIVPENPNVQWETHLDEDGVERLYACTDILLFTAIYKEAEQIVGKSQSMELYADSIDGNWEIIEGQKCFKFSDACFLGLQVLGEEVEPCFEGAAFFSHYDKLEEIVRKLEKYNLQNGGKEMKKEFKELFKLSDSEKARAIWSLINTNEEGHYFDIIDVYDEYAICYNYDENEFYRFFYTKNDETDSLTIDNKEVIYMMYVTKAEADALNALRTLNGDTFEHVEDVYTELETKTSELEEVTSKYEETEQKLEEIKADFSEKETKVLEKINQFAAEADTLTSHNEELESELSTLKEEVESLRDFKYNVLTQEKLNVIEKYSDQFDSEFLSKYVEKVDEYTIEDLEKELAYELVLSKPSIFSIDPAPGILKDDCVQKDGIEEILSKYKK